MAVGAFGVQAQASGRNDLSIEGRKFCANAFFKSGSAALHHGTVLVTAQLGQMVNALTVEERKLPPGLKKPFPQVTNLADVAHTANIPALQESLYWSFGRAFGLQPSMLDERMLDSRTIDQSAAQFAAREWVYPSGIPYTFTVSERFEECFFVILIRHCARIYTEYGKGLAVGDESERGGVYVTLTFTERSPRAL
jgi:lipoate-protein ligase A